MGHYFKPTAVTYITLGVTADEWLWGENTERQKSYDLDYAIRPRHPLSVDGPWVAWRDVNPAVGTQVIVVLRNEKKSRRYPGHSNRVALVVSDKGQLAVVRDVLLRHNSYIKEPGGLLAGVDVPNTASNDVFAGYLVAYVSWSNQEVEYIVAVLSRLLSARYMPDESWFDVVADLRLFWGPSSPVAHDQTVKALVGAAAAERRALSMNAITALAAISLDTPVEKFVDSESRERIIANYRNIFPSGYRGQGGTEFEAKLGASLQRP